MSECWSTRCRIVESAGFGCAEGKIVESVSFDGELQGKTCVLSWDAHDASETVFAWKLKKDLMFHGAKTAYTCDQDLPQWQQQWLHEARKSDLVVMVDGADGRERSECEKELLADTRKAVAIVKSGSVDSALDALRTIKQTLKMPNRGVEGKTFTFSWSSHVASEVNFAMKLEEELLRRGAGKVHALNHADKTWKEDWTAAAKASHIVVIIEGKDYWCRCKDCSPDSPWTHSEARILTLKGKTTAIVKPGDGVERAVKHIKNVLACIIVETDMKLKEAEQMKSVKQRCRNEARLYWIRDVGTKKAEDHAKKDADAEMGNAEKRLQDQTEALMRAWNAKR